jgi:hypothetical protein
MICRAESVVNVSQWGQRGQTPLTLFLKKMNEKQGVRRLV